MKTYYHGTSADNLQSILQYGLSCSEEKIWSCSGDSIYLWSPDELVKSGECKKEYMKEFAFNRAAESAQIACAKSKDCRFVVLKIQLDESELEDDCSCENMSGSGAVCIHRDISIDEIEEIKVSNDFSLLRGYFIALIANRDYNNIEFTDIEMKVAEIFTDSGIYIDDIDMLTEWESVETPQLINA